MKAAAPARVEEQSSGGRAAARHGGEEEVSKDGNVRTQGGFLLGRKRKTITKSSELQTPGTEIHDKNGQGRKKYRLPLVAVGECLRAENEMLRLQLMHKMKELEAEQVQRLKLEVLLKNKKIKSLKKQNQDLRAENEQYRKTAKPPRNPRLCRFCNEYVLGHDYRNCSERRASASSEQDEGDDSSQHF